MIIKFNKFKNKYNTNDYILLNIENVNKFLIELNITPISNGSCKIINIQKHKKITTYFVKFSNSKTIIINSSDNNIIRKLTPKEIEQYEIELYTNKYSL